LPLFYTAMGALTFAERFHRNFVEADRWRLMLGGLGVTLQVSCMAVILGIALGVLLAFMRLSTFKPFSSIAGAYIDIIRGTPVVVQLMIFYFVLLGPIKWLDKSVIAAIAFGCNSAAYVAEIVRAGILSIDHGQREAGMSLGLPPAMTMRYIVLPQAVKNILPALGNELIMLIKETSILGYIGVVDLARTGEQIRARTLDAFMPLIAVAIVYYILVKLLSFLLQRLERRLRQSDQR
jgi:amine acid ABC transporter, permease protein, 3-TM region, His/Glu/Gln/Arg/opine family